MCQLFYDEIIAESNSFRNQLNETLACYLAKHFYKAVLIDQFSGFQVRIYDGLTMKLCNVLEEGYEWEGFYPKN
jgi:hypothetical protein